MENLTIIGSVQNSIHTSRDPTAFKDIESIITIREPYRKGLFRLEESEYITIIFLLNQTNQPVKLQHTTRLGEFKGVFASRSPHRPSPIGVSTVRLLEIYDGKLRVNGLDALNDTPVLDIKPYTSFFNPPHKKLKESDEFLRHIDLKAPKQWINAKIRDNDKWRLLHAAGELHGHYCPGLALGIHLAVAGMRELQKSTEGIMENLLAIVEMNHCATDGIQFVTGCTFGNNALIFEDVGKTALTLSYHDGKAFRITVRDDWQENLPASPKYDSLFEKVVKKRAGTKADLNEFRLLSQEQSFSIIEIDSAKMIKIQEIPPINLSRAPIHPDFYCVKCGEKTMGSRKKIHNDQAFCLKCAQAGFYRLTGHGINFYQPEKE